MPEGLLSSVVQIAIALIASGLLVKILTLRQDRRKIAGEATAQEANAASTLSGAALQMVSAAQTSSAAAEVRATAAEGRETTMQDRLDVMSTRLDESLSENQRLWRELNRARWENYWRETNEAVLKAALAERGVSLEIAPKPGEFPDFPPPGTTEWDRTPPGA